MKNIRERIEANKKLLALLEEKLCKNPELRFIQALWSLGVIDSIEENDNGINLLEVVDRFYEESTDTLKRICKNE